MWGGNFRQSLQKVVGHGLSDRAEGFRRRESFMVVFL